MRTFIIILALYAAPIFSGSISAIEPPFEIPPQRQLVTRGEVVSVYDGDTFTFQPLPPTVRVRIPQCWAPEIRGGTAETKAAAIVSRDNLRKLLPIGSEITVRVRTKRKLGKSLTFGRVVAETWSHEGINVAKAQILSGFATATKSGD